MKAGFALVSSALWLVACGNSAAMSEGDTSASDATDRESEVTVDTTTRAARAQYDANVAFATAYTSRCTARIDGDGGARAPHVLLTGFGRFGSVVDNATGRIVAEVVPGATYPLTSPPPRGTVDDPGPQLRVATADVTLAGVGSVRICAMILPVYWDLASALIAREIDAWGPDLVLMNGVAGPRQPIWIELGAVNRAARLSDGSNALVPTGGGRGDVPLVEGAPASEMLRGNLLAFVAMRDAARAELAAIAADDAREARVPLARVLTGAIRTSYPRATNTYLCNNVTYTTGYLMDQSGPSAPAIPLLRASVPVVGRVNEIAASIARDVADVPRGFVHWPSDLGGDDIPRAARVMRAMIAAQLSASDEATRGDNRDSDDVVRGGPTF